MNVVSYFNGMNCGMLALDKVGIKVDNYYSYEIDKYANMVSQNNYPKTKQMGSVINADLSCLPNVDLFIGGSPCQSFSVAGDGTGFEGKSGLFWEFVKAKEKIKPKYWMLENVVMKKEWEAVITEALGVEPILLNSADFGAQRRKRLFWTNIPVEESPSSDKVLSDIITTDIAPKTVMDTARNKRHERELSQKSLTCIASMYKGAGNNGMTLIRRPKQKELSVLNVNEVEKLMNVPLNYTNHVSNTQRYKMLGNGWDIAVIAHIFKGLLKK